MVNLAPFFCVLLLGFCDGLRDISAPASGPEDLFELPIDMTSLCGDCVVVAEAFKLQLALGVPYEDLINEANLICYQIPGMTNEYCDGIIQIFGNEFFYILDTRRDLKPADMCGILLTSVGCKSPSESRVWMVDIQGEVPDYEKVPQPADNSPSQRVLHLTDTHLDVHYLPGSNADCDMPLCCRATSGEVLNSSSAAGLWGDYRSCGTPLWTFEAMLDHIRTQHPDIDYVMWTGDVVPHNYWQTTVPDNLEAVTTTYDIVQSVFADLHVFPVLGNHEAHPIDQYMGPNQGPDRFQQTWLYNEITTRWAKMLPSGADLSNVDKGGFYSVLVNPGFRILTTNTMWGYSSNVWLVENSTDLGQELQWLTNELQKAEDAGEVVHILSHIPPGIANVERTWSSEYNRIVQRYKNIIRGQFYGHTHWDEFEIFHDEDGVPISVAYIAPSQTTWESYNPEYRIYTIDAGYEGASYAVLDHENWILDLESTNKEDSPVWKKLYSARDAYSMKNLNAEEWQNFADKASKDRNLFDKYFEHYVHSSPPFMEVGCDEICYKRRVCDMKTSNRNDIEACYGIPE